MDGRKLYFRPPAYILYATVAMLMGSVAGSYLGAIAAEDARELARHRPMAIQDGDSEGMTTPRLYRSGIAAIQVEAMAEPSGAHFSFGPESVDDFTFCRPGRQRPGTVAASRH